MLISQKDINNTRPPFIMLMSTGNWELVVKLLSIEYNLKLNVVDREGLTTRLIELNEKPFYVGAGIWELEYGTRLMTLSESSNTSHPAYTLWEKWLQSSK